MSKAITCQKQEITLYIRAECGRNAGVCYSSQMLRMNNFYVL